MHSFVFVLLWLQAAAAAAQQLFGIQSVSIDIANHTDLLRQIGAKIVRVPMSWRLLEEQGKNKFATWYLNYLDSHIRGLERAEMKIIIQMAQTPCWASTLQKCDQFYYRPKVYSDYADAMTFLLRRYGNRIYAWEIWNEPNLAVNWLRRECQSNNGLCPRAAHLNDEYMEFIHLSGAQEYSNMVKITYQKMRLIDSNIIVLAGSLAGSDVDYLNKMYESGIINYFTALAIHPYTSVYPQSSSQYGKEYGPDDCFPSTRSSKFWCFTEGVTRIRQQMVAKMDGSKPIWFTEFGFSSFDGWNGAGLQGQASHLERAIDIIQQRWSFVHVACVYELRDRGTMSHREEYFGLFDKNLRIKPSGSLFMRKIKNTPATTLPTPTLYPNGVIRTYIPYFSWPRIANAVSYLLWVNDYRIPNVGGKINRMYSPTEANCPSNNGQFCKVTPSVQFSKQGGQWWVTACFQNNCAEKRIVVNGLFFTIQ